MTPATARINAGQLDQRIALQQRTAYSDELGQPVEEWLNVAMVWARARPLRSRELFAAGQTQDFSDTEFTVRWRSDLAADWRVLWRDKPYEITAEPIDIDGQRQWLQLLCTSGIRAGR